MRLRVLPFTILVLCALVYTMPPVFAADYRMYDPNLSEEMKTSGLLEPISKEEYEREMAALNESENMTLGCDDFPRCDPATGLSPLLPVAAIISMVVLAGFALNMSGRNQR